MSGSAGFLLDDLGRGLDAAFTALGEAVVMAMREARAQ